MCGIAAIVERDPARVTPEADLAGMVAALLHRGPDEEGRVCLPGAALGMRRLAIVDLATGQKVEGDEALRATKSGSNQRSNQRPKSSVH